MPCLDWIQVSCLIKMDRSSVGVWWNAQHRVLQSAERDWSDKSILSVFMEGAAVIFVTVNFWFFFFLCQNCILLNWSIFCLSLSSIDKVKVLSLMLHAADISHPAKAWPLHYRWTHSLMEEFFRQVYTETGKHSEKGSFRVKFQSAQKHLFETFNS